MQAIKIRASQTYASWKVPMSQQIKESYPLPPYSTVIGMAHSACGFDRYEPMQVSVQGLYYSRIQELYTRYEFKPGAKFETGRHQVRVTTESRDYGITRGPGVVELVIDVTLVIHIHPIRPALVNAIADGLRSPREYLSLGRREDLLQIDDVVVVDLVRRKPGISEQSLRYDAWIPVGSAEETDTTGTIYRLNRDYKVDPESKARIWNKVDVRHVPKGTLIGAEFLSEDDTVTFDTDPAGADPVFLA